MTYETEELLEADEPITDPLEGEGEPSTVEDESRPTATSGLRRAPAIVIRVLLSLAVVVGAGMIGAHWLRNRPKAERRPPNKQAALVDVVTVRRVNVPVVVSAMGNVVPAQDVQLAARVGGEVVEVAEGFIPGGRFALGDVILRIDPKDYELAVRQAEAAYEQAEALIEQRTGELAQKRAAVASAEANLKLEMGQQAVAKQEYELLGQDIDENDRDLVLREPQLRSARANLESAKAAQRSGQGMLQAANASLDAARVSLDKARLDLERTAVRAPFDAVVRSRAVHLGAQVSPGAPLASLVGTREYWIRVSVPVDDLRWIDLGASGGARAQIFHESAWGEGVHRQAFVSRLMAELEPQGRMARLLVTVENPLAAPAGDGPPLLLDSYVRVEIQGRPLEGIFEVPRDALRDGGFVWVMGQQDTLRIHPAEVVWSGRDIVCVHSGLEEGDRLVVSDLAAPVEGMALRMTGGSASAATQPAQGSNRPEEVRR